MPAPKIPDGMHDFLDYGTTRNRVYDSVLDGIKEGYPIENDRYRLEIHDPQYEKKDRWSLSEQKKALLQRKSIDRKLTGTYRLIDKETGGVLDEQKTTIARIPYLTNRGTYIVNGNEYTLANQMRLKSGVYSRTKENGDHEAHFNVLSGGPSFRVFMEPKTGVFRMQVGQSKLKLYPLLRKMGVNDKQMREWWGPELFGANVMEREDQQTIDKAWSRLANARARKELGEQVTSEKDVAKLLATFKLDPEVTAATLGTPYENVTPDTLLRVTQKLVNINKGEEDTDDRDSLKFQDTWGAEDFFKERFSKDSGQLARRMLWRATLKGNLKHISAGALQPYIQSVFSKSGIGQPIEEINPLDALDQNLRIIRLGEGGIPSAQAVPDEARSVQPSHFMFIDPIRSPESGNVGVDARLTFETFKGNDRKLYTRVLNPKTGESEFLNPSQMGDSVVAFPGELERARKEGRKFVKAMSKGRMKYTKIKDVDYAAPNSQGMFTYGSNIVPLISGIKGGRLLMGAKMANQALALKGGEAPLVQSLMPGGKTSFEEELGRHVGAIHAGDQHGVVESVSKSAIKIRNKDGSTTVHELYDNMPFNRKSYMHNSPVVTKGQSVKPGQLLATSNFTDPNGSMALGRNLRIGYLPYKGLNYEDAIVISESAAKKLTSEHMYTEKMDVDNLTSTDRRKYMSIFPSKFNKDQMAKIGDDGVIKPGSVVHHDDPLILATQRRTPKGASQLHRGSKSTHSDATVTWQHHFPGVVTDVWQEKSGIKVAIKGHAPAEVGDKIAGRFGDKNIIAAVIPDDQMPADNKGRPLEVLANPLGVISRVNPSQLVEAVLGKIAEKTGKPYRLEGFSNEDLIKMAIREMDLNGVNDTETIRDPEMNRDIENVLTGNRFYMKLHHTAEAKESSRGLGAYTAEGTPSKGAGVDDESPKRIGMGELTALISHGALENIKDIKTIRGQKNDDYWRAIALGYPPPTPDIPNVYKKFLSLIRGAGINIKKNGDYMHLMAMTDKDVEQMSSGEIQSPDTVKWAKEFGRGVFGEKSLDPVKGGLFDRSITGGHNGSRWGHITLTEPMPQPVMEDPIRRLLGLTKNQFEEVIGGKREIPGVGSGGKAIQEALARINVKQQMDVEREIIKTASKGKRDEAVKRLKYLEALDRTGVKPKDLVVTKVPVIPPMFRPISATSKFDMVAGANKLYMDMMHANKNLSELRGQVGGDTLGDAKVNLYRSFKAVTGLGDPVSPELKNQQVRGLLKEVFGSSPKFGIFQRKLIGTTADLSGRATITPNPSLDMDQIGLPEDHAWKIYAPFVTRRLTKMLGNEPDARATAVRMVAERDKLAYQALEKEMEHRPVLATRAPALHRYSIMAFKPKLVKARTLQLSPVITPGFNADFDGDAMNFHPVVSEKAIQEAKEKMLPSKNLKSPADFGINWTPKQEFLQGLYRASVKRSLKGKLAKYDNVDDIVRAFNQGKLNIDDVVSL